jgi:hypothetical protein
LLAHLLQQNSEVHDGFLQETISSHVRDHSTSMELEFEQTLLQLAGKQEKRYFLTQEARNAIMNPPNLCDI